MHIAAALGVPTIGIYGPSSPSDVAAWCEGSSTHRRVSLVSLFPLSRAFFEECPSPPSLDERPPCLNDVSVEMVVEAVDRTLVSVLAMVKRSTAGHPAWLRCSSVTYAQYAPSSCLASRAPLSESHFTIHEDTPLAQL